MQPSPFSDAGGTVHVHLTAGGPLAEVFLIDHSFSLVSRAIGVLDADVEQGVYKVKGQLGEASAERVVILNRDQDIDLSDDLSLASAVPLQGTKRTHEFHMGPAADDSRTVLRTTGSGAQIFLCARRWSEPGMGYDDTTSAPDLSLHRQSGETIIDLSASGRGDRSLRDPMLGATVDVDPGRYLIRWRDDSGFTAEQSVEALQGWQTQAFLLEDAKGETHHAISILMGRDGFDWSDPSVRVAEEARVALADERRVASQFITESLFAKFEKPMLGLFGAHLMLLGRDDELEAAEADGVKRLRAPVGFDQSYFDGVVANLATLLGPNDPDVIALATQASDRNLGELEPVTFPPMLWRSWLLLIQASNKRRDLLPTQTWRHVLRLLPVRPFLVWSPEDSGDEAVSQWQQSVAPFVEASLAAGDEDGEVMRRLTTQLLAPRSVIEDLTTGQPT